MALTKVSGNILDPGINVAGVVTATGFDGPFSGGTDGNFSGNVSIGGTLRVAGVSTFTENIELLNTATGSDAGPELKLFRNSASPADADYLGQLKFAGESDTGVERNYAKITGKILDASNGTEDGILEFSHIKGGSQTITGRWRSDSLQLLNSTNLSVAGNADITGDVDIDNTTESTSKTTGALKVDGGVGIAKNLYVGGNLVVEGTRTEVQSASLEITDKTIGISSTGSPSDTTADGAGIVVYGATDKSLKWENSSDSWLSSEHIKVPDNKVLYAGTSDDLQIFHQSSDNNSQIVNTTGTLRIRGDSIKINNQAANKNAIVCESNIVTLYYDNAARLATNSTGISVTGEVAATQDYPNYRPRVDWNFVKVKKLDPRITYLRSGPASYVDEFGIVKMVGDNVPRFDHDSETGESRGLLIEPGRTSRLTQSTHNDASSHFRQYDRGAIIKGPDGVENSAREYTVDSNGGTGGTTTIWANQAIGIAAATSFSCFLKITRGSTMGFRFFDNNNNKESEKWTISGGAITDGSYATVVQSDPGSTEGTSSYELYPNGWVRCRWENVSAPGGNATSYLQLYIWDHAAANSAGDNIGYAVWGFQVENGAFCTSPIYKPTTAAVSRGSDFAYLDGTTGTEFDDIYKKQEGTFIIDWFNNPQGNHNDGYVFAVDDGTGNNRIAAVNSNGYQVTVTAGGSSQGTRDLGSINSGDNKIAFTYKLNDQATSLNGSDASVDTSCTLPTGLKYWWFGLRQGQYDLLGGYMKRIIYYPTRLPNNQLKTLSS